MHPLHRYITADNYQTSQIFSAAVAYEETATSLVGSTPHAMHSLYDLSDLVNRTGKILGSDTNFQGIIGERILSLVLEELISSTKEDLAETHPDAHISGAVLRETPKHEGKGFIVTFNNTYVLKHYGRTSFVVLEKTPLEPHTWYSQEKHGLQSSEIDGLAYIHFGDQRYLIIGEAKTAKSWQNLDSDYVDNLGRRIAAPFTSLFPGHDLSFLFMARENMLFYKGRLRSQPRKIHDALEEAGINTMFVPFPETPKELSEYAGEMQGNLPLVRGVMSLMQNHSSS